MTNSDRMAAAGIDLPRLGAPVGQYVPAVQTGHLVYTSGQLPLVAGELGARGSLGGEISVAEGQRQARVAALNAVAAAAEVAGGIDNLDRVVKMVVFVACTADFSEHAGVANGASEVLGQIFGSGHARSAVGMASLPLNAPVEVELVAAVASDAGF